MQRRAYHCRNQSTTRILNINGFTMKEHLTELENNPNFLRKKALKALAIAKEQEAQKIALGARYAPAAGYPVPTLVLTR